MLSRKLKNFTILFLALVTAFSLGFGMLALLPEKDNTIPIAKADISDGVTVLFDGTAAGASFSSVVSTTNSSSQFYASGMSTTEYVRSNDSGTSYSSAVTFAGLTTSSANYIKLTVPSGQTAKIVVTSTVSGSSGEKYNVHITKDEPVGSHTDAKTIVYGFNGSGDRPLDIATNELSAGDYYICCGGASAKDSEVQKIRILRVEYTNTTDYTFFSAFDGNDAESNVTAFSGISNISRTDQNALVYASKDFTVGSAVTHTSYSKYFAVAKVGNLADYLKFTLPEGTISAFIDVLWENSNKTTNICTGIGNGSISGTIATRKGYGSNATNHFRTKIVTATNGNVFYLASTGDTVNVLAVHIIYEAAPSSFDLKYDKNNESSITLPDNEPGVEPGTPVTVGAPSNIPDGLRFLGWNTLENGLGTTYQPGENITVDDNITLYAQFESIKITSVSGYGDISAMFTTGITVNDLIFGGLLPTTVTGTTDELADLTLNVVWTNKTLTQGDNNINGTVQTIGRYEFTGGVQNISITATLAADEVDIVSVYAIDDIVVRRGTPSITLPLSVAVRADDDEDHSALVTWTDGYNLNVSGEYTLVGTLNVDDSYLNNPSNLTASIKVIVYDLEITSIDTESISFFKGDAVSGLPSTVTIYHAEGSDTLSVSWNAFNTNTPGTFNVTGTLDLIAPFVNTSSLIPSLVVTVETKKIISIDDVVIEVKKGGSFSQSSIPSTVTANLEKDYGTVEISVDWDDFDYSTATPGWYTVMGTVSFGDPYEIDNAYSAELIFKVLAIKTADVVYDFGKMTNDGMGSSPGTEYFNNTTIKSSTEGLGSGYHSITHTGGTHAIENTGDAYSTSQTSGGFQNWGIQFVGDEDYSSAFVFKGTDGITVTISLSVKAGDKIKIYYSASNGTQNPSGLNVVSSNTSRFTVQASGAVASRNIVAQPAPAGVVAKEKFTDVPSNSPATYVAVIEDTATSDGTAVFKLSESQTGRRAIYKIIISQDVDVNANLVYGVNNSESQTIVSDECGQVLLPSTISTPAGYTFMGWTTDAQTIIPAGEQVLVETTTTFKAVYAKLTFVGTSFRKGSNPGIRFGFYIDYLNLDYIDGNEVSGNYNLLLNMTDGNGNIEGPDINYSVQIAAFDLNDEGNYEFIDYGNGQYDGVFSLVLTGYNASYGNYALNITASVNVYGFTLQASSADKYGSSVKTSKDLAQEAVGLGQLTAEEAAMYGYVQ